MRIDSFTLKGFIIPDGFQLVITQSDGKQLIKQPGDHSGGKHSFQQVYQGAVENWELRRLEHNNDNYDPINIDEELYSVVSAIESAGGRPLFVGGVVRDKILGKASKDIDVEVYGLEPDKLTEVLSQFGKVDTVGVSFGVIKLTTDNQDYDFTLPRRESKTGEGHTGFDVQADPHMDPKEAASRRDFTFNALAMTPQGKLLDFYQGLNDIKQKILRHTSEKFAEDPLRVLRGFQFASRFGMTIDPDTARLARGLKNEYKSLAKERVWGEWEKWAQKGVKPSAGLKVLRETGWIEHYPQLNELIGVPQDKKWHPEGDVWTHTLHVADEAARIADRDELPPLKRQVLVLAALCHDLGKVSTTAMIDGHWRAPAHPQEGVGPTETFLKSIGAPKYIIDQVKPLVAEHMSHLNQITPRSVRRLALRLVPSNIDMLIRVIEADHSGRPPLPKELPESARDLKIMAAQLKLEESRPEPIIGGADLMYLAGAGKIPEEFKKGGPHFGKLIDIMFELQIEGSFEDREAGRELTSQIFNDEYLVSTLYYVSLDDAAKKKLIKYGNDNNLSEEEILTLPRKKLESIVESS